MLEILRAHGLDAGPTQRPLLAGMAASIVADIPALGLLQAFGSLGALAQATHASVILPALAYIGLMLLGGVLYGWLFQRAANDPRGGWLFGMAFGFVLWMLGPIPLLQWLPTQPLLTGYPAVGLLLGELLWGLVLGVAFPYVHRPLRPNLSAQLAPPTARTGPQAACDPHLARGR
ncbi:hypothetical protein [Methylocystis sp. JR02]|uniref:hypothetical protein n=1 Tax=Methylocystis sp. JR02 TaxID=3046284 RepID=UPI0024BAAEF3|nr:hypothetical protein [Methylocystis sp. JR02]MDJ0448850.1 hypothetical protein [Methylocystis sp. JR02]